MMDCTNCDLSQKLATGNCFECKVEEFKKIAKEAQNNKCFNVSIGRLYYSIFIRLKYIEDTWKTNRNVSYLDTCKELREYNSRVAHGFQIKSSHEKTLYLLEKTLFKYFTEAKERGKIRSVFRYIKQCKGKRTIADYHLYEKIKELDVFGAEKTVCEFEKIYPLMKGVV